MFIIVLLESLPTPPSTHTSLLLERLSIGCLLNIALYLRLPYWCTIKFLQNDYPKYFVPFLKCKHTVYNACKSQAESVLLEVPHFATSVYKTTKHFDRSFAYGAPKIWNDLPDDVCSANSLHSFRKNPNIIPTLPTLAHHWHICWFDVGPMAFWPVEATLAQRPQATGKKFYFFFYLMYSISQSDCSMMICGRCLTEGK